MYNVARVTWTDRHRTLYFSESESVNNPIWYRPSLVLGKKLVSFNIMTKFWRWFLNSARNVNTA